MRRLSILAAVTAVAGALAFAPAAHAVPGVDSCANPTFDHGGQQGTPIAAGLCLYTV